MKFTRCDIVTCGAEIPQGKEHVCLFVDRAYDLCDKCYKVVQDWVKVTLEKRELPPPVAPKITLTPYTPPTYPGQTIIWSSTDAAGQPPASGSYMVATPVDQNGTPGLPYSVSSPELIQAYNQGFVDGGGVLYSGVSANGLGPIPGGDPPEGQFFSTILAAKTAFAEATGIACSGLAYMPSFGVSVEENNNE